MNKPKNLKTKIFLDSGDPKETQEVLDILGFLDGQTTNPSLITKHPEAKLRFESGDKYSTSEMLDFYKKVIQEIASQIPQGSVSIEVYADLETSPEEMLEQAKVMNTWIPNAHIKFPTNPAGLEAAHRFNMEGGRCNMTLIFQQAQAAAVYSATKGKAGDILLSPFIGRLDDIGLRGVDFIKNCTQLYKNSDGHVQVLAASVRNLNHFLDCIALGVDIITAPIAIIKEWAHAGMPITSQLSGEGSQLKTIEYQDLDLTKEYQSFDISHPLTEKGIEKFASDWNKLIK